MQFQQRAHFSHLHTLPFEFSVFRGAKELPGLLYMSISSFLSSDAIIRTSRAGACRWHMSSKSVLALEGHISIRHSVSAGLVHSLRTKPTNWRWSCIEVCSTSLQVELACNEGPRIARVVSKSLPKYRVHCINKEASPTQPGWLQGRYAPHSLHVLTAMPCLSSSQGQRYFSRSVAIGVQHWQAHRISSQVGCCTACSRHICFTAMYFCNA